MSEDCFKMIRCVTNSIKLRSFQYRFLHRALVLNSHLYRWGITTDNKCTFCDRTKETVEHLFWDCEHSQGLWVGIINWTKEYFNIGIDLTYEMVVFNRVISPNMHFVNFIVLVTKQFIYRERCMKNVLSISNLRETILLYKNIKKYNASLSGKIYIFNCKWQIILNN